MRYWLVGLLCVGLISGCNSTEELSSDNQKNDESAVAGNGEDNSGVSNGEDNTNVNKSEDNTGVSNGEDNTNYSEISCSDDLTAVLTLINEKRKQAQICGNQSYGPVDGLIWDASLTLAAQEHSNNMANYNFFSHAGLDESTVATRVTAQNYTWSYVSENIAGGQATAQSVVDSWMESEGHCKNIMSANALEMGLACSENSNATYTYYWTQVFAKSR